PLERTGDVDSSFRASVRTFRVAQCGKRVREGYRICTALERRDREQLASFTVEGRIDPRFTPEQLLDFGPAVPSRGGTRGEENGRRRTLLGISQCGREQLRGSPRVPLVQCGLRSFQDVALSDSAL